MAFALFPISDPYEAVLCLRCGAIATRHYSRQAGYARLVGGNDWSEPDEAIRTFREAVRKRSSDQAWDLE